jgi:hypothetical protein
MSEIYYALIIFPILFMIAMGYIYSSSVAAFNVEIVKSNCPFPLNAATANIKLDGTNIIVYNVTQDDDSATYHVTTFTCYDANINSTGDSIGTPTPAVSNAVYTTASNWFNLPNVGAYLFLIQETIETTFTRLFAMSALFVLFLNSPALVLSIPQYVYVNVVLIAFIALGGFMVIRG